jgi:hypothetical protein
MIDLFKLILGVLTSLFRSRAQLEAEILVLRQQINVLRRRASKRPHLNNTDHKLHGGKSTGPRTPEGLERSRRANWKHGHFSREAKAERSRLRAAILAIRHVRDSI